MKGVVLEIRDGVAAVLLEDKTVKHIRCDCEVGDTLEIEAAGRITQFPKRMTRWAVAAAAAIVLISGGSYGYNNAYAYSYVTLDANPSIEYVLNRRNEVLSVSALNEEAVPIVEELNEGGVRGSTLTELLEETTELLYRAEYLEADGDDCLLISVTSRGERQRETLNKEIKAFDEKQSPSVYVENATIEEDRSARSLGMSTGRYKLMEETSAENGRPEDIAPDFAEAPVEELLQRSGRRPASEKPEEGTAPQGEPAVSTQDLQPPQAEQSAPDDNQAGPDTPAASDEPLSETEQRPSFDGRAEGEPGQGSGDPAAMGAPSGEPPR